MNLLASQAALQQPESLEQGKSDKWQAHFKPQLIMKFCYDHSTEDRFRHGTRLLRWREDEAPTQQAIQTN